MKLEDEIVQKKFQSEYHKLSVNITFTHHWLVRFRQDIFKPVDITMQQFNILRILRGQYPNPASVNLLKERMIDKMSDASRLVERLRQKGLVVRKQCSEDRRAVDVLITDKGLKLLKEMDKESKQVEKLLSKLSETEAKKLNDLLDKLRG